jgi:hypothetical protein
VVLELMQHFGRQERTPLGAALDPHAQPATQAPRLVRIEGDAG